MTNWYEKQKYKQGYQLVIGCDEAGRGSLAGPVVAAAVALPRKIRNTNNVSQLRSRRPERSLTGEIRKIKDSKLLSPSKREQLSLFIKEYALAWAVGVVGQSVIDKINIHRASLVAMKKASEEVLKQVSSKTTGICVAVDGKFGIPGLNVSQEAVVDGDNKILSVAAASIIAKVYRDSLMRGLHKKYPLYSFDRHKGYGTLHHRKMIISHGLSPAHRLSFCEHLSAANWLSIKGSTNG